MRTHPSPARLLVALVLLAAGMAAWPSPTRAAVRAIYVVDRSDDVLGANACTALPNDCSLRGAMINANANPGSFIFFDGPRDITLLRPLSINGAGTVVDGGGNDVSVHLSATPTTAGNVFKINAADVLLQGLKIWGSSALWGNVWIDGATTKNVLLSGNTIGPYDAATQGCTALEASSDGVYISATGAPGVGEHTAVLDQNTIACITAGDGVETSHVKDVVLSRNTFRRNITGARLTVSQYVTVTAGEMLFNDLGVRITGDWTNALATSSTGNWIAGVRIFGSGAYNFDSGPKGGVLIESGAPMNRITDANAIAASHGFGIRIVDSDFNTVMGNMIGTDPLVGPSGNWNGIEVVNAAFTSIGRLDPGPGNNISNNLGDGVLITSGSHHTTLYSNTIGVDQDLFIKRPNTGVGVRLTDGARLNWVGFPQPSDERSPLSRPLDNIIGSNDGGGIVIEGATTVSNTIGNNQIGYADRLGLYTLYFNASPGIAFYGAGSDNLIQGASAVSNLYGLWIENTSGLVVDGANLSFNQRHGVVLTGSQSVGNSFATLSVVINGWDGINENGTLVGNFWVPLSVYANGGLGIDRMAPDDALNQVSTTLIPTITQYSAATASVSGVGLAPFEFGFALVTPTVSVYGVAPTDRDPSGYGEGTYLLSTTAVDAVGNWSLALTPDQRHDYPCYSAIMHVPLYGSSEFSKVYCRFDAFLPVIRR